MPTTLNAAALERLRKARTNGAEDVLRLALPKGRMEQAVLALLRDASVQVQQGSRAYRPVVNLPNVQAKTLKPQNVVEMLHIGARDVGFAGADWVRELDAELVELLDTELDPVRVVAAAPEEALDASGWPRAKSPLLIATEYEQLTRRWVEARGLDALVVRTWGATEVFPPEDADCIVDNTATGATLRANHLVEFDELLRSSTRLYANPQALESPRKREAIEAFCTLVASALEARKRAIIEVNVAEGALERVLQTLPAMREPTIAALAHGAGYAVRVAAPRAELPSLLPRVKAAGGSDIVVTLPAQITP